MKQIFFNKIKIENFLSVGSTPLLLDLDNKINIITGKNHDQEDSKNGVGKSTITDAIHFALYGSTIREISKEQIVNTTTNKNCRVELTLTVKTENSTDTYIIYRSISPTKCNVNKNGTDVTLSTMAKSTEYIQNILNCSSKVFQNSVVMSINNTVPFLAQSKVDKRKYIENMLQLEVFSQMLLKAREDYNNTKHEYDITRTKHQYNVSAVNNAVVQLKVFENEKQKSIEEILQQIKQKEDSQQNLQKQYTSLQDVHIQDVDYTSDISTSKKKVETLLSKKAVFVDERTTTLTESKIIKDQIRNLKDKSKPCPTCLRAFENKSDDCDDVIASLQEKLSKLTTTKVDKNIAACDAAIQKVKTELSDFETKEYQNKNAKNKIQTDLSNIQIKIENIKEIINDLKKQYDKKQNATSDFLVDAKNKAEKLQDETSQDIIKHEEQLKVLDCVKYVLSEDGVKTFLIKKVLNVLNTKLNYYLAKMHAPIRCEFDEFFDEKITDDKKREKSYFNFSGGERKRIDLACLFAFMDMKRLQGETVFSTSFYDELIDSSLDDKGVELVIDILIERNKQFNEGCYIITHRGYTALSKVNKVINLEKRNGLTYLLQ